MKEFTRRSQPAGVALSAGTATAPTSDMWVAKSGSGNSGRLASAREQIREKLASKRASRVAQAAVPAPRYDHVFFEGLRALEAL